MGITALVHTREAGAARGAAADAQGWELADVDVHDDAGADTPNADFGAITEASIAHGPLTGATRAGTGQSIRPRTAHGRTDDHDDHDPADPGDRGADVPVGRLGRPAQTMTPEFTWTYEPRRDRWVIRRHGALYLEIPRDDTYTRSYVERVAKLLNKER